MKRKSQSDPRKERHDGPDVQGLITSYHRAISARDGNYWERQRVNYESRYCLWRNQSWDGRKWKGARGGKPFPWLGAADSRVALVDLLIREDVAILMQAWTEQKILVRPTQPAKDAGWANRVTSLLRWLVYEEMEETEAEAELLANTYLERGAAALGVWWVREEQLTRETLSMDQIVAAAERAQQMLARGAAGDALVVQATLPSLILDPTREADVQALITAWLGDGVNLSEGRIRKVVRDLRESGEASFPRAIVVRDRPEVKALVWNEDIVLPPECTSVQRARHVFIRELLTETDLQSRARSYGYDADWVDRVIETQRGKTTFDPTEHSANRGSALGRLDHDYSDLFEVTTAYERRYDDDGVPGVYCTVFSPGVKDRRSEDLVGKHELLDYAHGQYPVTPFALERRSRLIDDSRGYGERALTWQNQIKRQWDARIDRADVATLPPSHHPPDEEPDAWGPGVKIPTRQADLFGYFEIPKHDAGSKEVEETVARFAARYFGRATPEGQMPPESLALRKELLRGWFHGWKRAMTHIVQLTQQYLPDEVFVRVVGGDQGRSVRVTREEIQGPFNILLRFNAGDLDREWVEQKLGLFEKALQFDVSGRLDRDEALIAALELIDPSYAERLVKPGEAAALAQIEDEQTVLTKLLLGIGVDVRGDEAFALRKQVLEQTVSQSPTVQQLLKVNPQARELVNQRLKQLDFNIQQKLVNPEIGRRLGTRPMNVAGPSAPAPTAS